MISLQNQPSGCFYWGILFILFVELRGVWQTIINNMFLWWSDCVCLRSHDGQGFWLARDTVFWLEALLSGPQASWKDWRSYLTRKQIARAREYILFIALMCHVKVAENCRSLWWNGSTLAPSRLPNLQVVQLEKSAQNCCSGPGMIVYMAKLLLPDKIFCCGGSVRNGHRCQWSKQCHDNVQRVQRVQRIFAYLPSRNVQPTTPESLGSST